MEGYTRRIPLKNTNVETQMKIIAHNFDLLWMQMVTLEQKINDLETRIDQNAASILRNNS